MPPGLREALELGTVEAVATLREAQRALRSDGVTPDWLIRVKAAAALVGKGVPDQLDVGGGPLEIVVRYADR